MGRGPTTGPSPSPWLPNNRRLRDAAFNCFPAVDEGRAVPEPPVNSRVGRAEPHGSPVPLQEATSESTLVPLMRRVSRSPALLLVAAPLGSASIQQLARSFKVAERAYFTLLTLLREQ